MILFIGLLKVLLYFIDTGRTFSMLPVPDVLVYAICASRMNNCFKTNKFKMA